MKKSIIILCLVCFGASASSQSPIPSILAQKENLLEYYEIAEAGAKVLYLPLSFGRSNFTYRQEDAIKHLENAHIVRIDLVYTDYPSKTDFSPLTRKRLESLKQILPDLFTDKTIEFRKVRQTMAKTKDVAESFVHGFFIYFRPLPTKTSAKREITKLKSLLEEPGSKSDTSGTDVFWCWNWWITVDSEYLPEPEEGVTRKVHKLAKEEAVKKEYLSKGDADTTFADWDTVFVTEDRRIEDCISIDGSYFIYDLADTTVTKVFNRHNWSRSLIIADVTGSMYPYTGQLLKWLKLNLIDEEKRYFIFFNDGDEKPDDEKVIGKTGGIYSIFSNNYEEVEKTIVKAMEHGSGGDAPENNIEALLESDKICNSCDSIVMIVDNWAPIKDISLLSSYHKPVKVVVCGVLGTINKDYLKLARDTKGSIHLIEEDIYTLADMKDGEKIKIRGVTYTLVKGEFVGSRTL